MTLESYFPPDKRVENEIEALILVGHEVDILCFGKSGQKRKERYKGALVIRIFPSSLQKKSSVGALKFPFYFNFWRRSIRKLLLQSPYNVVHIHDLPLIKPVVQLKKIFPIKIVLDLHENWPGLLNISPHTKTFAGRVLCNIREWEDYEKSHLNSADRIIVVVEEAKSRVRDFCSDPDKIFIVSNTVNLLDEIPENERRNEVPGKKVIIYEGGITRHRGLQNVITAISQLDDRIARPELKIVGAGSYLNKLKMMVRELRLNEIVKFYGHVSQEMVYKLLSAADIAIIPHIKSSHTDNTVPHKLFHYMYAGLPVIASDCLPLKRIIDETGCGVIYSDDDPETLKNLLVEALTDTDFRQKYSGAKKWVIDKYNWANDANNLLSIYNGLEND